MWQDSTHIEPLSVVPISLQSKKQNLKQLRNYSSNSIGACLTISNELKTSIGLLLASVVNLHDKEAIKSMHSSVQMQRGATQTG